MLNHFKTRRTKQRHLLHKKWSFSLRISSVNVTKPADLVTFTKEILNGKLYFCVVIINNGLVWRTRIISSISIKIIRISKKYWFLFTLFGVYLNFLYRCCFPVSILNSILQIFVNCGKHFFRNAFFWKYFLLFAALNYFSDLHGILKLHWKKTSIL